MKQHYMVFMGRRGASSIVWRAEENPAGVYYGDTPDEACQAASAHLGVMGAFYAIPGHFWGVIPGHEPKPFGAKLDAAEERDRQLGKLIEQVTKLTNAQLPPGDVEGEGVEE